MPINAAARPSTLSQTNKVAPTGTKMRHNTITVPADLLPLLRSGAQIQAGRAAQAFAQASERVGREQNSAWFLEPRELMERYNALLDATGWSERLNEHDVKLNRDSHAHALTRSLEEQHTIERNRRTDSDCTGKRKATKNMRKITRFMRTNHLPHQ